MGVVYLARHRHIGRDAAIKVLLPELTKNEDIVARFLTEARATAAIRHPGIVEILDCDIDAGGRAYIVMEYLRGESLANCLARARRSLSALSSVVSVGSQVASGLAAAHERGIVHRDLKPDNLFLATDGGPRSPVVIKILDFGIAKLISGNNEDNAHKTRTGSMLGTPAYMSPEQARDASAIDDRADVYALGCILFEMVAGRPPFVRAGAGEVMIAHVIEPPPRLSSLVPEVDPTLEMLVAQMLEKDPAARPQTMTEVRARLDAMVVGHASPLTTAIMPAVDSGQPNVVGPATPAPAAPAHAPTPVQARHGPGAPLELPPELSSPSGRMIHGGTLLLPAAAATTTTHSTTMSDSAAEVTLGSSKGLSLRKRPLVLGAAIAGVGLIVVIAIVVSGSGSGSGSASGSASGSGPAPSALPPSPRPPIAAAPAPPPPAPVQVPVSPPAETPAVEPAPPSDVEAVHVAPRVAREVAREAEIEVRSEPTGAEVWMPNDTAPRGHTPFKVSLDAKGAAPRVVLKAHGYVDKTLSIDRATPEPMAVTLEKVGHDHGKKKGSETPTGKFKDPSGYKRMGD